MNKRDELFTKICSVVLNRADKILAKFIYDIICKEIYDIAENDCSITDFELNVENFERVVKLFNLKKIAQNSFLLNFKKLSVVFKKNNRLLKKCAEPIQTSSTVSNLTTISSVVTGGALCLCPNELLFPVAAPVAVAGGIVSAVGGGVVMSNKIKELRRMKTILDEAKMLTTEELDAFYALSGWLTYLEELKKSMEVLIDYDVLKELFEHVMKFLFSLKYQTNIKIGEYKDQLKEMLKNFLRKINQDNKLKMGNQYTPVAITFVFVVCLMNDQNRIMWEGVIKAQCLNSDPMFTSYFGALTNKSISEIVDKAANSIVTQKPTAKVIVQENLLNFGNANNLLTVKLSDESHKVDWLGVRNRIKAAAVEFEKAFFVMEDIYIMFQQYESIANSDETHLTTIIVKSVPADATEEDIKMAIEPYLPEEAWDVIKLQRLTTSGNNWLIQVLPLHSQQLYQQVELVIKDQSCVVVH